MIARRTEDSEERREIDERIRKDIGTIIDRLHEKKVQIHEGLEVEFVDREEEARAILEGVARIKPFDSTVVLYGPKGCGKTTLFEALVESIHKANEMARGGTLFDILMVTYKDGEKVGEGVASRPSIMGSRRLIKNLEKPLKKLGLTSISINVSPIPSISIGIAMGQLGTANTLIDALHKMIEEKKLKKNGRLLVVIDEARASSEEEAGRFRDWLEVFANDARRLSTYYWDRLSGTISFIILTSDALVSEVWLKVGNKVDWVLMWNLPRDAFERLADQLGISIDRDLLWRLVGGNLRELKEIKDKGLERWLTDIIRDRVVRVLTRYWEHEPEQTKRAIREVAENPDRLAAWGKPFSPPLEDIFLERNIAISIVGLPGSIAELPREPWIGEMYAYQIPAFYYVLKAIARKGDLRITPEDVKKEAAET